MAGFKESIKKAIGNSEIFNKTADFLSDAQKKFKSEQALEKATSHLNLLYLELGKTAYMKTPLTAGRTIPVIRADIKAAIIDVANCQALVDELNATKSETKVTDSDEEQSVSDDKTD